MMLVEGGPAVWRRGTTDTERGRTIFQRGLRIYSWWPALRAPRSAGSRRSSVKAFGNHASTTVLSMAWRRAFEPSITNSRIAIWASRLRRLRGAENRLRRMRCKARSRSSPSPTPGQEDPPEPCFARVGRLRADARCLSDQRSREKRKRRGCLASVPKGVSFRALTTTSCCVALHKTIYVTFTRQ